MAPRPYHCMENFVWDFILRGLKHHKIGRVDADVEISSHSLYIQRANNITPFLIAHSLVHFPSMLHIYNHELLYININNYVWHQQLLCIATIMYINNYYV